MSELEQLMADLESIRCRVNDLETKNYLQQHLAIVYWELHRLNRKKEGLPLYESETYESPLYESAPVSVVDAIESRDFGTSVTT